ncbi:MAG: DUF1841 family protein [Prolixibacteraceae bacterium]|nr:DUF1841 family protein [Prolixibacteraceae bacterium]
MKANKVIRDQIFLTIKNQIRSNNPPETKITYDRLRKQGFDDFTTMQLIGQCLAIEIFGVLKHGKPYDNDRYVKNLIKLPQDPFE